MFILLVDYDGQAGADLYAIDGEMRGQQARNLPTTTEFDICVEVNP